MVVHDFCDSSDNDRLAMDNGGKYGRKNIGLLRTNKRDVGTGVYDRRLFDDSATGWPCNKSARQILQLWRLPGELHTALRW